LAKDASGTELGFIDGFCLEDAAYFANVGDPPSTRAFRDALAVLGNYSDVLLTLAEGRNIEQAKADVQALGASIASTIAIVPHAAPLAASIGPVLTALGPVIEELAKAQNFREMRQLVGNADPLFGRLVAGLKAASPWMFETLVRSSARRVPKETRGNPQLTEAVLTQIEGYRMTVSNFVVLLDELAAAHTEIVVALQHAEDEPLTLALVADRTQRLNAQADAVRGAFATLRRGGE
jgi:hypothetical protein